MVLIIEVMSGMQQSGNITLGGLFIIHHTTDDGACGELFPQGLGHAEAMIFAIEEINRNQSVLPTIKLGYDIRDYCESPEKAMRQTYDFVRRNDARCVFPHVENETMETKPIAAVIGPTDSGSAVLVGSLLQVGGIPVISHSATSNELSSSQFLHFFRTASPDGQQVRVVADILQYFNWNYVAAVAMDDSYGKNGMRSLELEAEKREKFCLSFVEFIPRKEYNTTIKRIVRKLRDFPNIGVVVLWVFGSYGVHFLEEAAKQKLFNRTWILSDGLATQTDLFKSLKTEDQAILHGSLGIQPPYVDMNSGNFGNFLIERSTKSPNVSWWREFWLTEDNKDCLKISNPNKRCKNIVVHRLYETYTPYVVDAVYAVAHALHNMKNCSASKCENLEDLHSPTDTKDLQRHLRLVRFSGLTGEVSFDHLGDPVSSSYEIVHYQLTNISNPQKLVIGSWLKSRKPRLHLNVSKIMWNTMTSAFFPKSYCQEDCPAGTSRSITTPCCWKCLRCPDGAISTRVNEANCTECPRGQMSNKERSKCLDLPEVEVSWSSLASVLVILFSSIGFLLIASCSFIFHKHRKTPLVKAANRELSAILMLSITMSFVASILSLVKPTDFMCGLIYCWKSMVLVTFISVLIIKTMKILSAFHINVVAERFKKFILVTKKQTVNVLVLLFPPTALFVLWFTLDSPYQRRIIQANEGTSLSTCSLHQSAVGMSFQVVISVYTSLLALACTYYAFKARTLPENFNEARYIGFSMYILLLSSGAYLPIDIGLKGAYATNLTCALILVASYGLLTCMFGPKIYAILITPEQNTHHAVSSQVLHYSFGLFRKGKVAVAPAKSDASCNKQNMQLEFSSTTQVTT
ncbi:Metabotropic glutamate receptor 3 [Stylophora pistillata]|uniref:Metabotropic glutamate receptor 3 n=1 Tax=Stylophora pistillata TaxID=50429 RepID=A0A2B4S8S6_STYPI|nr:Metabotropic glutamate receptor 3 [Stylophora pistillata]